MEHIDAAEFELLRKAVWILATIANGGKIQDSLDAPVISFRPAIADRGTWVCSVTVKFANEGEGRQESTVSGTVSHCLAYCRRELQERLGSGYV